MNKTKQAVIEIIENEQQRNIEFIRVHKGNLTWNSSVALDVLNSILDKVERINEFGEIKQLEDE